MRRALLATSLVCACSVSSEPPPCEAVTEAARAYLAVHNEADHAVARTLWGERTTESEARVDWFRERVGQCSGFEPMRVVSDTQARYVYTCERGQLELGMRVDAKTGRITHMWSGVRGAEPNPAARKTLQHLVALANGEPVTAGDLLLRGFGSHDLEVQLDALAEHGRCAIDRVHLGSNTGGLFVLECAQGSPTVVVDVDALGALHRLEVFDRPLDTWRDPNPSRAG